MRPPKIWITHLSVAPWICAEIWDAYLKRAEEILGDRLIRLDHRDPVRRVADTRNREGKFIVGFEKNQDRRWLAGRFEKSEVTFSIDLHEDAVDRQGRSTTNSLTISLPQKTDGATIKELFEFGNSHLMSFYAYSDLQPVITGKGNRHQRLTPGLDIQRELPGIFWLTYFGPAYTKFFGADRISSPKEIRALDGGGVTICLGDSPGLLSTEREQAEHELGARSFAGHGGMKREGEFALTLAALGGQPKVNLKGKTS